MVYLTISARAKSRIVVGLLLCALAPKIIASELSASFIKEGRAALDSANYAHALNAFELATRVDPQDGEAYFFYGVAHNRSDDTDEALVALNRSEALGYANESMDLERGYALVGLGRNEAALKTLQAYELAHPHSGIAKQLLARVYLRSGDAERAHALALEAKALNPNLADTADLIAAYADRARGDSQAIGRFVEDLVSREPNLPFAERIQKQIARQTRSSSEKPWSLALNAGVGFNDNVIAIGEGVPLPRELSNEESVVGSFGIDAGYNLLRTQSDFLHLGYNLSASLHESDLDGSDLLMNTLALTWQHRFSERWTSSLSVADQYTLLGGERFRNLISLRPAMSYRHSSTWRIEAYARIVSEDYYFNTAAINDRDGENLHVGILAVRRLGADGPALRIGAQTGHYSTQGRNYDRDRKLFFGSISDELMFDVTGEIHGTFSFTDYDHANSLTGFRARRDDEAWSVGVLLTRPLPYRVDGHDLEVFGSFDFVDNDSNIQFFDYDQVSLNVGVSLRF